MKIGNAPCSWGVLEFDLEGEAAGYVQVLDEMAETGYKGTELGDWGFMPTDPEILAREVHSRGLVLLSAFVPVMLKDPDCHATGETIAVRTAHLLAAVEGDLPFIVLADDNGKDPLRTKNAGRIKPEMGLSDSEWEIFAEGRYTHRPGGAPRSWSAHGLHHHCAGFGGDPAEIEKLLTLTHLCRACFDPGHYALRGRPAPRAAPTCRPDAALPLQRFPSRGG
jgi:inosose dehydratase